MVYEMHPDNCERCAGMMGGVRGNENRHPLEDGGYRVLCDYCSVEVDAGLNRHIICEHCKLPWGQHVMMKLDQVEAIWERGIYVTVCSGEIDWEAQTFAGHKLVLVRLDNDGPTDPCDEDYMKEISS